LQNDNVQFTSTMHSENNEVNLGDTAKIDDMKDLVSNMFEICSVNESDLVDEWDNLLVEESNLLNFEDSAKINGLEVIAENHEICLMEDSDCF
jgi:hypothetical protein